MALVAVGISHRTAAIERREKASLAGGAACTLLQVLTHDPAIREVVALSTCNRTEIYATGASAPLAAQSIARALVGVTRISPGELTECRYLLEDAAAARQLLRVAASLDSMVIGESEIQGQVRAALALAEAHGAVGAELRELFRRALVVGKRVRRETAIGRGAVSVSSVAVELARELLANLASRRALLIGAGHAAESTARALLGHGLQELSVANRSPLAAEELAERFGGRGLPLDAIQDELARADIVICSTDSPAPLLTAEVVGRALHRRASRRILLIDIAVPRDVESRVGLLPGVTLHDIDDLERVVHDNLNGRRHEARVAERIVEQELGRLASQAPTVSAMPRQKATAAA